MIIHTLNLGLLQPVMWSISHFTLDDRFYYFQTFLDFVFFNFFKFFAQLNVLRALSHNRCGRARRILQEALLGCELVAVK